MPSQEPNLPVAYAAPTATTSNNYESQSILVNQTVNGSQQMIYTWRLAKSIRCFSTIDIFFCVLYSIYYLPLVLVALFPIAGYYGAKNYDNCKLYVYAVFIVLIIVGRCLTLGYYEGTNEYGVFITILTILVEVWILKILCKLISYINKLPETELYQIKDSGWTPIQTEVIWF